MSVRPHYDAKRMRQFGKVGLSQEPFIAALKMDGA